MKIVYDHNMGAEAAYERVEQIIDTLKAEYGSMISSYDYKWSDDKREMKFTIDASGVKVNGNLTLDDRSLVMTGNVPFLVRAVFPESKLEKMAKEQLDILFS
jgi:hypothetical protein